MSDTTIPQEPGLSEPSEHAFAKGMPVVTPYGVGEVEEYRVNEKQVVVALANKGGKAYLDETCVKRKKRLFEMDDEEKLAQSRIHREEGNRFYKMEDYPLASHKYELARVYLRQMIENNKEEHLSLLNNIALTGIKLGNYADAVFTCDESISTHFSATSRESLNAAEVKCIYLRAMANRKRGDLESALKDLVRAVKAAPTNRSVRDEYESLVKEMKAAKEKEASMFKKAFPESSKQSKVEKQLTDPQEVIKANEEAKEDSNVTVGETKSVDGPESFLARHLTTIAIGIAAVGLALILLRRSS